MVHPTSKHLGRRSSKMDFMAHESRCHSGWSDVLVLSLSATYESNESFRIPVSVVKSLEMVDSARDSTVRVLLNLEQR